MSRQEYDKNNNYNKLIANLNQWYFYKNKIELNIQKDFNFTQEIVKKLACEREAKKLLKYLKLKEINFIDDKDLIDLFMSDMELRASCYEYS